jgi:16S rRNA (uracil1498-N3)-methyltransferase
LTEQRAPRFHVDAALRPGGTAALPEDSAHHALHVLRLQAGDAVTLFNGRGGEVAGRIASVQKLQIRIDLLEHRPVERESPLQVTLVQGVSSGERMEFTIRKAVELGVAEIRPVLAAGSVARPKGERAAARQGHWQRIAIAACEQCGRNRIPVVHPLVDASAYRAAGEDQAVKILLSPSSQTVFSRYVKDRGKTFILAAGPEAGFDAREEAAFLDAAFVPLRLGARVLRTETAALAALAALNAVVGDY